MLMHRCAQGTHASLRSLTFQPPWWHREGLLCWPNSANAKVWAEQGKDEEELGGGNLGEEEAGKGSGKWRVGSRPGIWQICRIGWWCGSAFGYLCLLSSAPWCTTSNPKCLLDTVQANWPTCSRATYDCAVGKTGTILYPSRCTWHKIGFRNNNWQGYLQPLTTRLSLNLKGKAYASQTGLTAISASGFSFSFFTILLPNE